MRSTISFLVSSGPSTFELPPVGDAVTGAFVDTTVAFGAVFAAAFGVVLAARVVERLVFFVLVGVGLLDMWSLDPAIELSWQPTNSTAIAPHHCFQNGNEVRFTSVIANTEAVRIALMHGRLLAMWRPMS